MKIHYIEIETAFDFVSSATEFENQAYLNVETSEIYYQSDMGDFDPLPDDIDDANYINIPHKKDLDLGYKLVRKFVAQHLPSKIDIVESFFRKRGAYNKYKQFLESINKLEEWYQFEQTAVERALKDWCKENKIEID